MTALFLHPLNPLRVVCVCVFFVHLLMCVCVVLEFSPERTNNGFVLEGSALNTLIPRHIETLT